MKLREWLRGGDAATESGSKRDGVLSYAAEWHSFTLGVYWGLRTKRLRSNGELPDNEDVQDEPHYYAGGFVIGTLLQLLAIVILAVAGSSFF